MTSKNDGIIRYAMISQPMAGRTDEDIIAERSHAIEYISRELGYAVINSFFKDDHPNCDEVRIPSLYFLSRAIYVMSKCEAVYFVKGWEEARGCRIEHEIAQAYGLKIIYGS